FDKRGWEDLAALPLTSQALVFFGNGRAFPIALALATPLFLADVARRRRIPPEVAILLVGTVLLIPVVVWIERWKHYAFHPRHVLFTLPAATLVLGTGIDAALR